MFSGQGPGQLTLGQYYSPSRKISALRVIVWVRARARSNSVGNKRHEDRTMLLSQTWEHDKLPESMSGIVIRSFSFFVPRNWFIWKMLQPSILEASSWCLVKSIRSKRRSHVTVWYLKYPGGSKDKKVVWGSGTLPKIQKSWEWRVWGFSYHRIENLLIQNEAE